MPRRCAAPQRASLEIQLELKPSGHTETLTEIGKLIDELYEKN